MMSTLKPWAAVATAISAIAVGVVDLDLASALFGQWYGIAKVVIFFLLVISSLTTAALEIIPWRFAREQEVKMFITKALDLSTGIFTFVTKKEVRACVFLPDRKDAAKMGIRYHSSNMEGAADLDIRFEKWQGCVGKAWGYETGIIAMLGELSEEQVKNWSITKEQYALTRDIKSVRVEPIFVEHNGSKKIVGLLSFDSKIDINDLFQDERFTSQVSEMAGLISKLLSNANLLKLHD